MSITIRILGQPARDNCLHVTIDSGQSVSRLLFDCGANSLESLSISEVQDLDAIFFSHFHMDHVCGFDHFFRCNFGRTVKPNLVFGPRGTAKIIQHRAQGYWWNLNQDMEASWRLFEVSERQIAEFRIELGESFANLHTESMLQTVTVLENENLTVTAFQLKHHGPCLAYRVDEKPKSNINMNRLAELGLHPGPWMQELKSNAIGEITIAERTFELDALRTQLLDSTAGESVAYVTDFLLDQETHELLSMWLADCDTLICESQYRDADRELAIKNHHTTTAQVAELARNANAGQLILFHLSDRYPPEQWTDILKEVKSIFESTSFPAAWKIGVSA